MSSFLQPPSRQWGSLNCRKSNSKKSPDDRAKSCKRAPRNDTETLNEVSAKDDVAIEWSPSHGGLDTLTRYIREEECQEYTVGGKDAESPACSMFPKRPRRACSEEGLADKMLDYKKQAASIAEEEHQLDIRFDMLYEAESKLFKKQQILAKDQAQLNYDQSQLGNEQKTLARENIRLQEAKNALDRDRQHFEKSKSQYKIQYAEQIIDNPDKHNNHHGEKCGHLQREAQPFKEQATKPINHGTTQTDTSEELLVKESHDRESQELRYELKRITQKLDKACEQLRCRIEDLFVFKSYAAEVEQKMTHPPWTTLLPEGHPLVQYFRNTKAEVERILQPQQSTGD